MSESEQRKSHELLETATEQLEGVVAREAAIDSTAITAAEASQQVTPIDKQAPRSWDLHKSGW
jgi:hypothetical protein